METRDQWEGPPIEPGRDLEPAEAEVGDLLEEVRADLVVLIDLARVHFFLESIRLSGG